MSNKKIIIRVELDLAGHIQKEISRHSVDENDVDELLEFSINELKKAGQHGYMKVFQAHFNQGDLVSYTKIRDKVI